MRTIIVLLLTILSAMELFSQSKSVDRQPVVAGSFYPSDKDSLKQDLVRLFSDCKKPGEVLKIRAIISPHAGYVFSGKIAASAFSTVPKSARYENIFLIGSSHVMAFEGASVYNTGDFITPLGKITVNREIGDKLKKDNDVFNFPVTAHLKDHCLEVQIPFIQYYFETTPRIVPIIIGTTNTSTIRKIADALRPWFTAENLFVISSDFSHYPSNENANIVDNKTAGSILTSDPAAFLATLKKNSAARIDGLATSMCGWTSGLTLMYLAGENSDLVFKKVDYCNSGDSRYGNKDEVVGYNAIVLTDKRSETKNSQKPEEEFSFSQKEKDILFEIARSSIKSILYDGKKYSVAEDKMPDALMRPLGAFVTLKINGTLRGCIGRFVSSEPLCKVVSESAVSSAFEDTRFHTLTKEEYPKVDVEITVLGPRKKINSIDEIKLGKHGIYIKKDFRAGTMLPQVPVEYGWTLEEFLGYTSRDKAGIGWDGWKDAEIYIYEGLVLEENRK
jgi:MEMO1 family protein